VKDTLERLGVKRLLLAIHDSSFPSEFDEDIGRGAPTTRAAGRLLAYAARLGFTGIQLGPQGQTSRDDPSPYDGTMFARHLGNVPLARFAELVDAKAIAAAVLPEPGGPCRHRRAYDTSHTLLDLAYAGLPTKPELRTRLAVFRAAHASWVERDGLYEALSDLHGGAGFRAWGPIDLGDHAAAIEKFALGQLLVHEELARVRREARGLGLALYGDLQVGYSDRDVWAFQHLFLRGYRLGAPPSRTNPEGQPWNYPVLDPDQREGAVRGLMTARADKAFAEYDSLRIDHPHGLVCPWVYAEGNDDPHRAVRDGARLYESPDLSDHPVLARFAIVRPEQLDRTLPRHADRWVTALDPAQIDRYAILFDALVTSARAHGRSPSDLSCEVLSTMPVPLGAILERYGLGRWRITQKADLDDRRDVYRSENAEPHDWVMLGNHDTVPVFALIKGWSPGQREAWGRHLAARLHLARPERLASDGFLATCMLAELFVSRAENVSIFFADLFGYEERFNVPGLVDGTNWTLRLPYDFEPLHAERLSRGAALDLALAAELALA